MIFETGLKKALSVVITGSLLVASISGCTSPNNGANTPSPTATPPSESVSPSETLGTGEDKEYTYTNNMTMYDYKQDKLLYNSDGTLNLSQENLVDKWEMFKGAGNLYIQASTGETSNSILIRNLDGESVVSSSDGAVALYLKDNTMLFLKDGLYSGVDATFIDLLDFSIKAMQEGYGYLQSTDLSDDTNGLVYEYTIDVMGYDNIHKLYSNLGEQYADTIVNQFRDNMTTENEDGTKETADLNMRYAFIGGPDGITSAGCYIYEGTELIGIDEEGWSNCSSLWVFDGYYTIYDWEMPEIFYTIDYEDMSEENGDKIYESINRLLDDLGSLIQAYFDKYAPDTGDQADGAPETTEGEPAESEPGLVGDN